MLPIAINKLTVLSRDKKVADLQVEWPIIDQDHQITLLATQNWMPLTIHPQLTAHHCKCRLQFSRSYMYVPHIRPVLLTSELRFYLDFLDGRRLVWR